MTEYAGSGDPKRTIELLWGEQPAPARGPKPRLAVPDVVRAAIQIADTEGLAALSMRRVADALGAGVMSLYTYVPGKAELLDLMLDAVLGEPVMPEVVDAGWRARLEHIARENWAMYLRHPWLLQVATARPALGPNLIAKYDYELRAMEGAGLSDVEMDSVVTLILNHVHGSARGMVEAQQAQRQTGMSDQQWWEANGPLLEKVFDGNRFPIAARVGAAAGEEYGAASAPEHAFEFGLARILDGIAALINARAARPE